MYGEVAIDGNESSKRKIIEGKKAKKGTSLSLKVHKRALLAPTLNLYLPLKTLNNYPYPNGFAQTLEPFK